MHLIFYYSNIMIHEMSNVWVILWPTGRLGTSKTKKQIFVGNFFLICTQDTCLHHGWSFVSPISAIWHSCPAFGVLWSDPNRLDVMGIAWKESLALGSRWGVFQTLLWLKLSKSRASGIAKVLALKGTFISCWFFSEKGG